MIGILDVFEHQFPVGRYQLPGIAQHPEAPAIEYPLKVMQIGIAEVFFEIRHVFVEAGENDTVVNMNGEFVKAVGLVIEVLGHPALALDAPGKWNAFQVALKVVDPFMIRADKDTGIAFLLFAEFNPAVRTAIAETVDIALGITADNDGAIADIGGFVILGIRNFADQSCIIPTGAAEYPVHFLFEDGRITVDSVWDVADVPFGPLGTCVCH
jgi:hypothetical protein